MKTKTVIVAGSSGLIGKEVVRQLIQDSAYKEIILLVRRKSGTANPKIKEILFDFSQESYFLENIEADQLFICIGTTMKKAKTKENFKEVDLLIPVKLGRLAKTLRINQISVISAMGANSRSLLFYNKVKGEMERDLMALQIPHLTILRPSLLIGEREEFRFGERLAEKMYMALPIFFPKKFKPIHASDVAKVMVHVKKPEKEGQTAIIENSLIHELSCNI
jgi:uncharacterized protein YbjT (DUF2867 family)